MFGTLLQSRRAVTALFAISCLTVIALVNKIDTSMPIATVAVGLAASNGFQKKGQGNDPQNGNGVTNG